MTKALTLRLPDEMHEGLRREAFERRLPITTIIQEAIEHRRVNNVIGCDVCGKPHVHVSTPGGFRFCADHYKPTEQAATEGPVELEVRADAPTEIYTDRGQ